MESRGARKGIGRDAENRNINIRVMAFRLKMIPVDGGLGSTCFTSVFIEISCAFAA